MIGSRYNWIFFLLVLLVIGNHSAMSQVRTWAFSRDTVYHRNYGAEDTLRIVNAGVDTLRFDSVRLELVRPTAVHFEVIFYPVPASVQRQPYFVAYDSGNITYSLFGSTRDPRTISIKSQDTAKFSGFKVGRHPLVVTKRAAIEPGDTLVVRMIFMAAGGRGRDTLVVVGMEDIPMGLQPGSPELPEKITGKRRYDPLGRRVEPNSGIPKSFFVPVLVPNE